MLEKPLGGRGLLLGGVPGRRGGQGHGHRRRRRRPERGRDRDRHGRRGLRLRPQHRPPARARGRSSTAACSTCFASTLEIEQRLPDMDLVIGAVLVHGAQGAARDHARAALADEAQRGAGRRLDRPGRLLRDLARRRRTPTRPTRSTGSPTTASPTCPARCRSRRTYALTNATMPYVVKLAERGRARARSRPTRASWTGLNVAAGKLTYEPVARDQGLEYTPGAGRAGGRPRRVIPRSERDRPC